MRGLGRNFMSWQVRVLAADGNVKTFLKEESGELFAEFDELTRYSPRTAIDGAGNPWRSEGSKSGLPQSKYSWASGRLHPKRDAVGNECILTAPTNASAPLICRAQKFRRRSFGSVIRHNGLPKPEVSILLIAHPRNGRGTYWKAVCF